MQRNSAVYKVLSPEKIPPLDMGAVLSIFNNSNHPQLSSKGVTAFLEAQVMMQSCINQLLPVADLLREYPIKMNEFMLALNYINSYIYILGVTCEIPANSRLLNYAKSVRGGVA